MYALKYTCLEAVRSLVVKAAAQETADQISSAYLIYLKLIERLVVNSRESRVRHETILYRNTTLFPCCIFNPAIPQMCITLMSSEWAVVTWKLWSRV